MIRTLTDAERAQLIEVTAAMPRDQLLFHIALSGPLYAGDLVAIDLGDVVGLDEESIMTACMVVAEDDRRAGRRETEFFLSPAARALAAGLVANLRQRCVHASEGAILGDHYDKEGVLRCTACNLPSDWRFWPLFQTSGGRRLTSTAVCKRFEHWRQRLGWPAGMQFDCLRVTYEARAHEALRRCLGGEDQSAKQAS